MNNKAKKRSEYTVATYDMELERFTAQKGVKPGPYSLWGLRRALRKLRALGYEARKGDPSVMVQRTKD
jgi:hypothetical protein